MYRKDFRPTMWSMWDVWYLTGCASDRSERAQGARRPPRAPPRIPRLARLMATSSRALSSDLPSSPPRSSSPRERTRPPYMCTCINERWIYSPGRKSEKLDVRTEIVTCDDDTGTDRLQRTVADANYRKPYRKYFCMDHIFSVRRSWDRYKHGTIPASRSLRECGEARVDFAFLINPVNFSHGRESEWSFFPPFRLLPLAICIYAYLFACGTALNKYKSASGGTLSQSRVHVYVEFCILCLYKRINLHIHVFTGP